MDITIIIAIIIVLFIFSVLIKVLKMAFKLFVIVNLILIFTSSLFIFFYLNDAGDFKNNFSVKEKLVLLIDEETDKQGNKINQPIAALKVINFYDKNTYMTIKDSEVERININNLKEIKDSYYRILLFTKDAFKNPTVSLTPQNIITTSQLFKILSLENPYQSILPFLQNEDEFTIEFEDNQKFKNALFIQLLNQAIEQEPKFLLQNIQNKNAKIYPQTTAVSTIIKVPLLKHNLFKE